jgi:tetratricopeptide (TPR) repeat protein
MRRTLRAFSRNTEPYLRKRRNRRLLVIAAVALAAAALSFSLPRLITLLAGAGSGPGSRVEKAELLALWDARDMRAVRDGAELGLSASPMDSFFLAFKGLSSFYLALAEIDADLRLSLLNDAIFALRKSFLSGKHPLESQARYILGKAYFHKGQDYYEEAIGSIEAAMAGERPYEDAWEYLALAAQALGYHEKSVEYFEKALAGSPDSAELKAAGAQAYLALGDNARAESLALSAYADSQDDYVRERSMFMLAELYRKQGRMAEALERYNEIKIINPESADAWYYEGLVLMETGEPIKARASWRKAVSIDPMHGGARQKLAERS